MRTVGLVTTARSDWGIQRSVAAALRARGDVKLHIIAGGMHLRPEFGNTVDQITADGFEIAHRLDFLVAGDRPADIAASMGAGVTAFARLFCEWRPDILTILGDRFDMLPAAIAATPYRIPIAHVHGGESTLASFDDQFRHAMTKLSHLHFVAAEEYCRRVRQMGEETHRVHVVGAPGLDDIARLEPLGDNELAAQFGLRPGETNLLVVYHPETLAHERTAADARALFDALARVEAHCLIVQPNADTAHRDVQNAIAVFCRARPDTCVMTSVARRAFLSLMRRVSALVGNSSAGIIEAPSLGTPVVNIGDRQKGRIRAANVIDVAPDSAAIAAAIKRACSPRFLDALINMENPYGDGRSGPRIAAILATVPLGSDLICKPFVDRPAHNDQ